MSPFICRTNNDSHFGPSGYAINTPEKSSDMNPSTNDLPEGIRAFRDKFIVHKGEEAIFAPDLKSIPGPSIKAEDQEGARYFAGLRMVSA
jgi:hypothetical protein